MSSEPDARDWGESGRLAHSRRLLAVRLGADLRQAVRDLRGPARGACWSALVRLAPRGIGSCGRVPGAALLPRALRLLTLVRTSVHFSLLFLGKEEEVFRDLSDDPLHIALDGVLELV
jgi:hypothetical protein